MSSSPASPPRLLALSLGGPCLLRPGYAAVGEEMVWLDEQARYLHVLRGEEAWLKRGYRVEIWVGEQRAATVIPPPGGRKPRRRKR